MGAGIAMRSVVPAVVAKIEGMVGDCAPLGFFDPLGFSKDASPETMKKFSEAELKHGRVAMLACAGMITADKWHPLFGGKLSANPLLAFTQVPKLGLIQILTFIMFMEVNNGRLAMFGAIGMLTGSYITGKGPLEIMDA